MDGVSDSHHQSALDAVYVYVVPWSETSIVPSYPHYPPIHHLSISPIQLALSVNSRYCIRISSAMVGVPTVSVHSRCCIRICSAMVGVLHRPLLPASTLHQFLPSLLPIYAGATHTVQCVLELYLCDCYTQTVFEPYTKTWML